MREFYSLEDSGRSGFLAVMRVREIEVHGTCMLGKWVGWLVDVRMMKRRRGWESCKHVCMCMCISLPLLSFLFSVAVV